MSTQVGQLNSSDVIFLGLEGQRTVELFEFLCRLTSRASRASLLNLPKTDVMLCQKSEGGEWAIIQRLNNTGRYADAHGNAAVLLTGNNPQELVNE